MNIMYFILDAYKVLVMDDISTTVISSVLTMYDITERKVIDVQNFTKKRQPFPELDVVYFVTPTVDNVRFIIADFPASKGGTKPKYAAAHIIFTSTMNNDIMSLLQNEPYLVSKVRTLKELHLEYVTSESYVFNFDLPGSLAKMYGDLSDHDHPALLARKLTTLCISLNEYPYIRYQNSSPYTRETARLLNENLTKYQRSNPKFWTHGDEKCKSERERGQLLILDRSFDPVTPLMHEYSYQAMCYDLLPVKDGLISYESETDKGKVPKQALLNENDEIWAELRHTHISKAITQITEKLNDFVSNNASAAMQKKAGGNVSIQTLASVVKEFPEYKQTTQKLAQHVAIGQQCMNAFTGGDIFTLSQLEQTITSGVDENNDEVSKANILKQVIEILKTNTRLSRESKVRLVAIYCAYVKSVTADDRKSMFTAGKLPGSDQQAVVNLERLLTERLFVFNNKSSSSMMGSIFKKSTTAKKDEGDSVVDTRHIPALKIYLDQFMNGELAMDKFPPQGASLSATGATTAAAKSVRKFNANSRWGKKDTAQFTGCRFLVFIAGGVSYSELRVAYDNMSQMSKEVIIGGTQLISPSMLLNDLANLDDTVGSSPSRQSSL